MPRGYGNFSYVVDSSFQPFSMQEMLTPFMAYKEAYEQNEAAYMDLTDKADKFKYLSETLPEGSQARQIYEGYANDLKAQAEDLASSGLTMGNRRALTGLKRRYQGEIGRLAEADMRRRAQIAEQQKIALQDPTRIFSRDASLSTIDDYLDNPDLSYKSYSGALLTQQVGQAASNLAKQLRDQIKTGRIDAYTKTWMEERGFDAADVLNAIEHPNNMTSSKARILNALIEDAVKSSRVGEWGNNEAYEAAKQYARQGLWNSIGQIQVHSFADYAAQKELDFNYKMREADEAAKRAAQATQAAQMNGVAVNPVNIYSTKEKDDISNNLTNYAQYFTTTPSGRVVMNEKGLREYNRRVENKTGKPVTTPEGTTILTDVKVTYSDSPFKKFIDSNGGAKYFKDGKMQPGNLGNLWLKYNAEHNTSKYDATKTTEFDFTLADSQQKNMKEAIQTAARGTELQEVDFDRKTNTFKPVGKALSMEDLNSDKYSVVATRFSPYGSTVMIKDEDGNVHRYRMPVGINPTNEHNRDIMMAEALKWQEVVSTKQYKDANGVTHQATPEEIAFAQAQYAQALQNAYLYHSQLGGQNKTKEQEFNLYGY